MRNLQILMLVMFACVACCVQAERLKYAGKVGTAMQLIKDNYVEEVEPNELFDAAMKGMVSKLDQFSEYIPPAQYEQFQSVIEQKFGGLGILIEGPPASERLTIVAPIPGTPAFKAGLQPGDTILEIDGKSTEGLPAMDATELMRGPLGEPVDLKVRRMDSSQILDLTIERADIQVDSVYGDRIQADSSWDYFLEEDERIAYIRVTMFGERTVSEFKRAIDQVKDRAQAIILDLRYNPGGILPSAVVMCDMLIDQGTIVSTKGRRESFASQFEANAGVEVDPDIPIVIMVNGQSASASEIMAGCLQDSGRAKVAGSRSYGKGTVQQVFPLEDDITALKFTTARFYRPSGKNIHRTEDMDEDDQWGVVPEPGLLLDTTDLQELYLTRRWRKLGDPRITTSEERPPEPECAGDPQLKLVLNYLRRRLNDAQ